MAQITWTGAAGNNNLNDAKNWSSGTVPTVTDDVDFNYNASGKSFTGTLNAGTVTLDSSARDVTFQGPVNASSIDIAASGTILFNSPVTAETISSTNGRPAVYLPYNSVIGTLNVNQGNFGFTLDPSQSPKNYTTTIGNINTANGAGSVTFAATVVVTGDVDQNQGTINAQSNMTVEGKYTIGNNGGKVNINGDLTVNHPIDMSADQSEGFGSISGTVTLNGNGPYHDWASAYNGGAFISGVSNNPDMTALITIGYHGNPACYHKDTFIEMVDGSKKKVSLLKEGDILRGNNKVVWVGMNTVHPRNSTIPKMLNPYKISRNGQNVIVSPGHCIFENGFLIPADKLSFGAEQMDVDTFEFWHFQCEKHCAVMANDIPSESFLNVDGPRGLRTMSGKLKENIECRKDDSFAVLV